MDPVTFSGPLFDGTAKRAARDGTTAARKAVAKRGAELARGLLAADIRVHDTGRALAAVTTTGRSVVYQSGKYSMPVTVMNPKTDIVVTSSLATYGPWLEGTGSRNQTTRFKGYHSFRKAAQELSVVAQKTADRAMQPYFGRMQ